MRWMIESARHDAGAKRGVVPAGARGDPRALLALALALARRLVTVELAARAEPARDC